MNYQKVKQYRLPNFDYSGEGQYFVTICINERKPYFGRIENEAMFLSEIGKTAGGIWNELPTKFANVRLGTYQIMPDHFHGIIIIKENDRRNRLNREKLINQKNLINQIPTGKSGIRNNPMELAAVTLGRIIRWFKGRVKFEANRLNPDFK
jgi:REP element-mobilizing transposase RayT